MCEFLGLSSPALPKEREGTALWKPKLGENDHQFLREVYGLGAWSAWLCTDLCVLVNLFPPPSGESTVS